MTIYMTKVWGLASTIGPLQFSTRGWRERARDMLRGGDYVILVGTHGDQTPDDMKGRLLGIMEPTTERVRTRDFEVNPAPSAFVDDEYKWPFALLNRRAWVFPERPLLTHISERTFNMDSAQGIVPLNVAETARVEALNWTEAELLKPSVQAQHRIDPGRRHGQRNAPPPSTTRAGVMHMRSASAYTYALRKVGAPRTTRF